MILRSQHDIFIFISMYLKLKTISDVLVAANRGIRVDINHARSDEDLQVSTWSPHITQECCRGEWPGWLTRFYFMVICVSCKLCKLQLTSESLWQVVNTSPGEKSIGWSVVTRGLWSVSLMSVRVKTNSGHQAQTPRGVRLQGIMQRWS